MKPRFNYLLNPYIYFFNTFYSSKNNETVFVPAENINPYLNSRVGLKLLLSSISKNQLNVAVQAYTCHSVLQSIKLAGHIPVFIDITDNFQLDLEDLKTKIKFIDVIIITHIFGFTEKFEEIQKIAKNKIIIEDCAHAFLSKYDDGSFSGSKGDASVFSTGIGKFPPIGLGGFCIVNNPEAFPFYVEKEKLIKKSSLFYTIISYIKVFLLSILMRPPLYGFISYRLGKQIDRRLDIVKKFSFSENFAPNWVAKIFLREQKLFLKLLNKQQNNANILYQEISNKKIIPRFDCKGYANNYIFTLLVENRDELFNILLSKGIEPGKHFHNCISWATEFGYKSGECPKTEDIVKKIITVPVHPGVKRKQLKKTVQIINAFCT